MGSRGKEPACPPMSFGGGTAPRTPKGGPGTGSILLPYQQKWLNDRSQKKIWLAARQIGKSFALSMEAVVEGLEDRCNNLILSSSERQSREVMQKVFSHLRYLKVRSQDVVCTERESREEVELPNGSRIISLPANPDTVRGFSGNVFLDEFAFHKDSAAIWKSMYPAITRGKRIRVTSTANGKSNMFYRLWAEGDFSKHETSIHEARAQGLDVDIDALRGGITDPDSWAQEYECRFLDEATAFVTYEMISACEDEGANKELNVNLDSRLRHAGMTNENNYANDVKSLKDVMPEDCNRASTLTFNGGDFYLGFDVARKGDLSIFWLWEKVGDVFWTRMVREMRNTPFYVQRDFLYGLLEGNVSLDSRLRHAGMTDKNNYANDVKGLKDVMPEDSNRASTLTSNVNMDSRLRHAGMTSKNNYGNDEQNKIRIRRCCIDSTGLGAQLAEEAVQKFGPVVEAVTFTQKVKEDLAVTLRRRFEDRQVRIPADRGIREDIHSVKRFTTSAGNIRFDAERTELGHADRFWAAALGLHAGSVPAPFIEFESAGSRRFFNLGGYL